MRALSVLLRLVCTVVVTSGLWGAAAATGSAGAARAATIENLMVPSAAMGRDIPVTFMDGGPHAVYLLDSFNAGADVSSWVTVGNAMNTLAGKGISVVAPAGGAYSMYTDWERDGSRQWETFLSGELPDWLAANKGLAPGGHAVVGASQGGYAAMALAEFHPARFRYAGSMSGVLYPAETSMSGALITGMREFGGLDVYEMWGPPQAGRWKWHDPWHHASRLRDEGTRVWVFSPQTSTTSDPAAMIGYPELIQGTNRLFYAQYGAVGGKNGHFDFPTSGAHDWSSWAPQLGVMSGDIARTIR